ncbi:MAG: hypothetical protein ACNA77_05650 [Opitutales bacterium]
MLGSKQQTWLVVDIGGRWIKCARYERQGSVLRETGSQVIDIQAEGLLSAEEVGAAIGRVLRAAGEHPLAVVLPQAAAASQVVDLPKPSAGEPSGAFEAQLLDLIGLSAERCVYDRQTLAPFGAYANPQWTTVAKEETLSRQISPLLGEGLRVEAATTVGNALVAAFRQTHPEVAEACLVDLGATQTTLVQIERGEPVQMTSLPGGGENWTEALVETSREAFEEIEARLFRDDILSDPLLGPALRSKLEAWRVRVLRQIEEWRDESGRVDESGQGCLYLFGGYAAVPGLVAALSEVGEAEWKLPQGIEPAAGPVWAPSYGAALMAAGMSGLKASILPRSLVKLRQRRLAFSRLKTGVLYLFVLMVLVLGGAIAMQQDRREALVAAKQEAEGILSEIQASKELLARRDQLARRIEPLVRGQWQSLASIETFRKVQQLQGDYDFTLLRFADQRTYFQGMDGRGNGAAVPALVEAGAANGAAKFDSSRQAFVVELTLRGSQAERMQLLGEIVGRLREESYFANVDRLVGGLESAVRGPLQKDEVYALLLTLAGEPLPGLPGGKRGVQP